MHLRTGRFAAALVALVFMVVLGGCGSLVQGGGGDSGGGEQQGGGQTEGQGGDQAPEETQQGGEQAAEVPEDPTLSLSIPSINKNIDDIPTGRGDDVQLLIDNAAVHVYPTGFPWQEGANTFLAGHVEGYEGTPSYKAFDGIQQLQNGDEIIVTDANGTDYTYQVYNTEIVQPEDVQILDPVPGQSIVTLQTCEIVELNPDGTPNYSDTERFIVQGELVS
ncbi:sortase [Rubrobacter indicoceani]|uniref:sortase n=1 Tax=Rubrobacter indicoceani TaxID=2051957 RepID=UPI0013C45D18|nr:sortase [Rubrobacter indicoceani]